MKSLDNLANTLNIDDFKPTKKEFADDEKFHLMRKKGIFRYDFFDSIEKLDYQSFPSRNVFFNSLADKECSMTVGVFVYLKQNSSIFR